MARRMKYDVEAKEEAKEGEGGFLSRWSARKSQIAKGEDVPDEVPAPEIAEDDVVEDEEDATLTDAELLEKYDLPDPEAVTEESGLEQFLNGKGQRLVKSHLLLLSSHQKLTFLNSHYQQL